MLNWMRPCGQIMVYIACPYTRVDVGANVHRSNREWDALFDLGLVPVNPLWSHYQHLGRPRTWDDWMRYGEEWVRRSDVTLRLSGESEGADREVELTRRLGKPVFYSRGALAAWALRRPYWQNWCHSDLGMQRFAVCGLGRHGKGTAAKYLAQHYGFPYLQSTSEAAAEVVFLTLRERYGYATVQECWNDRAAHREEWGRAIAYFNGDDPCRLYTKMVRDGNTIIEGIRRRDELRACVDRGVVDLTLWIDASLRCGRDDLSCEIGPGDCDVVIDNNLDESSLHEQLSYFAKDAGLRRTDHGPGTGQDQGRTDGAVSDDSAAQGVRAGEAAGTEGRAAP